MISSWASLLVTINNKPLLFKGAIHPLVQGATTFFQPFWILVSHIYACLPWEHRSGLHPRLSIIMQARLVCLSSALLLCTDIDTCICMHMYKWKTLLALVIVDLAFFILHSYHSYEPLVLLSFSSVPFLAFYCPLLWTFGKLCSENFMQTHKIRGCEWCGSLSFVNTFMFFFCMGQKRHFHFSWVQKRKNTHWISLSLSLSIYLLTHSRKSLDTWGGGLTLSKDEITSILLQTDHRPKSWSGALLSK